MSYQVLARKWRPRNFETLVGQEHVVRALRHALDNQRLHHAWLFTGTRGVGKTTLSRILAKCLNCIGSDERGDITSTPCGVCRACVEIDAGRFVDYIEMDAASNRGVDEMAQLLEQAVYAPSNARFKVYMIDEVHMLTSHAFNAMLKTLEEPPGHVKFILATTDPQKIPVTVLSRCLQFNLKQMPVPDIVDHLAHVLEQEGIAFERGALQLLGRAAAGSMRDALSLTDQAIAYSAGQVGEATVRDMLGALDQTYLLRVLDALADADGPTLMTVVDEIASRSLSFGNALQELGALLHRIAAIQLIPSTDEAIDADEAHLRVLAGRLAADDVQLYYQIAAHGRRDLSLAPDEITGFSMTLLRMLAFRIDDGSGAARAPAPAAPRVAPPVAVAHAAPVAPVPVRPVPAAATPPVPAPVAVTGTQSAAAPLVIDDWVALVDRLKLTGMTSQLAQQAELVAHDDRSVTLRVPIRSLAGPATLDKLKAALTQYFGRPVAVTIEVGAVQGSTVAAVRSDERAARQTEAQAIIDADPFVQAVVRDFGGARIVPGSVKPV
jgi:DNA polymerase-3 subunit gamma/tau